MENNNSYNDINRIKRGLSNELLENMRKYDDNYVLNLLLDYGYSYEEIMTLITGYKSVSGLDLINCNEVVKKGLTK